MGLKEDPAQWHCRSGNLIRAAWGQARLAADLAERSATEAEAATRAAAEQKAAAARAAAAAAAEVRSLRAARGRQDGAANHGAAGPAQAPVRCAAPASERDTGALGMSDLPSPDLCLVSKEHTTALLGEGRAWCSLDTCDVRRYL